MMAVVVAVVVEQRIIPHHHQPPSPQQQHAAVSTTFRQIDSSLHITRDDVTIQYCQSTTVKNNNNKTRITQPATTLETPNTALVTATKTKLINQAKPTINIETGDDELLTSTVKADVKHMYKVQATMGRSYLRDCANAARAEDANATPSDLVALVNNIDRFPSAKAGRLVIVSSNKNKNKKRKKGEPKVDATKYNL